MYLTLIKYPLSWYLLEDNNRNWAKLITFINVETVGVKWNTGSHDWD